MLTQEERKALVLAKSLIEQERYRFICVALYGVQEYYPELGGACERLRTSIQRALLPQRTLMSWQKHNGFDVRDHNQPRADRIAWIDWMLDEPAQ